MTLLLLFNNRLANASLSITDSDDALTAAVGILVSPSVSITDAADSVASTSTVLVSPSASLTEADDAASGTSTVLISPSAAISEATDIVAANASAAVEVVSSIGGGAGGYIRRVRTKPKKPIFKPKPLDRRTVQVVVCEHDDAVASVATVEGQSLAAAALALAEAQAARKRMVEHDNDFWMAA